jgi:hypothetical protein
MTTGPEASVGLSFVDNAKGRTLAEALNAQLRWVASRLTVLPEVRIASAYFNPAGFSMIANALTAFPKVRLLLGAEPRPESHPGRAPAGHHSQLGVALAEHLLQLERDRDQVPFDERGDSALHALIQFLQTGRLEVRRYEKGFLHGKAYFIGLSDGVIVGSSNFTAAGLTRNLELNLGSYQPEVNVKVCQWFDGLWDASKPLDLTRIYARRYAHHSPYIVYLRALWELFGKELGSERIGSRLTLTAFQKDGVWRARRLLDARGGALVADEVGLGKTFVAGDIIREYVEEHRTRVLIVAPAALRDGPWRSFLTKYDLTDAEVVSYEELQRDHRLTGEATGEERLKHRPNSYGLVVVDEAQAFRNPEASRSRALRALLRGTPRKKLLMLSATPVNNSVMDLYYLLSYFLENDAVLTDRGVPSLLEHFREAARADVSDLHPNSLFDVLDATTVRRTRHFIKRYYPDETFRNADGSETRVRFPRPVVLPVTYDLDAAMPGLFERLKDALAPASGQPRLTLARYAPQPYRKQSVPPDPSTAALVGLLRSAILKRFESSAHAFATTLEKLIAGSRAFLEALKRGKVLRGAALAELEDCSDNDTWAEVLERDDSESASAYDINSLGRAVQNDIDIFEDFAGILKVLPAERNPKLRALEEQLAQIAGEAPGDAHRDARKVLVFTFFADTVDSIYEYLQAAVQREALKVYRDRFVAVSGSQNRQGVRREDAVYGFAPQSADAPSDKRHDRFDLLITTDALAEGMNLQQCRHVINFDLPWNPMRLVQRHGRVDRIGSQHEEVFLRCFLPDRRLNDLLDLENRLRFKLAHAAASIGQSSEVIPGSTVMETAFSETREEIDRLRMGDADLFRRAGERPGAHSSEEFRQELERALANRITRQEVTAFPGGAGSAMRGRRPGYFFCARVDDRVLLRFVERTEPPRIISDTLTALSYISSSPETQPDEHHAVAHAEAYTAWQCAQDDIYEYWMRLTDKANVEPKLSAFLRKAASHLRKHHPEESSGQDVERVVEALEAPRDGRVERMLRDAYKNASNDMARSRALVEVVTKLGLEPYSAPEPLRDIDKSEIELVCWMAVISE